jgi:hypothetical protein
MQLGESAGHAAALAVKEKTTPSNLDPDLLIRKLAASRLLISFFNDVDISADDPHVSAAQYFGTKGFIASYDAKLDAPLTQKMSRVWLEAFEQLQLGEFDPMELAAKVQAADEEGGSTIDRTRGEALLEMWNHLKAK